MNKAELNKMPIPEYNNKQRYWNSITHLIGAVFAVGFYIALVVIMAKNPKFKFIDYFAITMYSLCSFASFFISFLYHFDNTDSKKKRIKRLLDHLTIFINIAGTYMPVCIIGLKDKIEGIAILITILALAVLGLFLNIFHMEKKPVRIITLFLYVVMGWLIIFVPSAYTNNAIPFYTLMFLIGGGIVYTIGAVLYAYGHLKNQWFHVVFHIFVNVAAILQAISIYYLIIA